MAAAEDEDMVEALPSRGPNPALGERVRPRRANWRLHHVEPLGAEDLIERPGELRVSIPEQEVVVLEPSGDREVPSLLGDPGRVGSAGRAGHVDPPGGELDEEQDVERLQEHGLDGEEVTSQHAPRLCSEELGPGGTDPPRCGPETGATQGPSDGARSDLDPELAQLALDPHAPPPWVLPAQTEDEIDRLGIEGRPAGALPRMRPLPPDQLPMPAKERLGRDHEGGPALSGERPARCREERPVTVLQLGAPEGAAQDLHLVAEDRVLQLELRHAPVSGEHPDEADEHEVEERSHGARDATCDRQPSAESSFGSPQ